MSCWWTWRLSLSLQVLFYEKQLKYLTVNICMHRACEEKHKSLSRHTFNGICMNTQLLKMRGHTVIIKAWIKHYPPIAMHSCLGGKPERNAQWPQRSVCVLLTGEDPAFNMPEIKFLYKPGESSAALMTVMFLAPIVSVCLFSNHNSLEQIRHTSTPKVPDLPVWVASVLEIYSGTD